MASERGTALGDEFAATNREVMVFARSCSPAQWATVVPGEDWSVGVVIHHIAEGHGNVVRWLEAMAQGEAVSDTQADIDQVNVVHAAHAGACSVEETLALLGENGARAEALLRSLTDEKLDQMAPFGPAGGRSLPTVAVAGAASGHAQEHLAHARSALGD